MWREGVAYWLTWIWRLRLVVGGAAVWLLMSEATIYAQSCNGAITILQKAINECSEINENWACYGNTKTEASPADLRFYEPRDRQPVSVLKTIDTDDVGAVLMYLRFQDTPAPLRVVVFGDTQFAQISEANFTLSIDSEQEFCQDSPPGLVIQTNDGAKGSITVNDVEIDLASTAFITVLNERSMIVVNLGGQVSITIAGVGGPIALPVGQQVDITLSNGTPTAIGPVTASPYAGSVLLRWIADNPQGLRRVTDPNTEAHPVIPACGGLITFGQAISSANFTPGQECLYRFCANRGDVITVDMEGVSRTLNPWIDVRRPNDQLLVFNNDRDDADFNSQICNAGMPETSCDYMIVARPNHNASLGNFTLRLNRLTTCTPPPSQCEPVTPTGLSFISKTEREQVTVQTLPPLSLCAQSPPIPRPGPEGRSCLERGPNGEPRCDRVVVIETPDPEESPTVTPTPIPTKLSPFTWP